MSDLLAEQINNLPYGISRHEFHDKAWALYHAKTFDDGMLQKLSIHTIRNVFDAIYDTLFCDAIHIGMEPDGFWYVYDTRIDRIPAAGRWSTEEEAIKAGMKIQREANRRFTEF